jgi:hypothetical protein
MCAPLALTGLQLASSLAGAAASGRDLKRQAAEAERSARADAQAATARAEYARDDALSRTATLRARAFASAIDPKSESLVASLAAAHAKSLDESGAIGQAAAEARYRGQQRALVLRAARRPLLARSLLGLAGTLADPPRLQNRLRI